MDRDTDEFAEYYGEYGREVKRADYAHPDYYGAPAAQQGSSAAAKWPLGEAPATPGAVSAQEAPYRSSSEYDAGVMQEYRGPAGVEGYTVDAGEEQRDAAARGSAEGGKQRRGWLAGIGTVLLAIGGWLVKLKSLAFLLKFGFTGFSVLFSIGVYSLIFGWRFAIGLVALLFVHEMGHALVMKLKGIPVGGLIFVPMLGAAVLMQQMPKNARDEAEVGIAGPVAGALAATFCLVMAQAGQGAIWAPLAYFGFFLNLFNLIPIVPFDGGRVLGAVDRRVWILGFVGLLAFQIWSWLNGNTSLWLLFFIIIAAMQLWTRGRGNSPEEQSYYNVPVATRIVIGLLYFGLAAVLILGMMTAHSLMPGFSAN